MKARDIMKHGRVAIAKTDTLGDAQDTMTMFRIRHLPVIDAGKLIGMLSERDVLLARAERYGDWWRLEARDAMQEQPPTARPDDSIDQLAARMAAEQVDALPIVERGKLVGLVTAIDVLDAEAHDARASAP